MSSPVAVCARVLGRFDSDRSGPMVIALGGIHGNEPAGVQALERVVAHMDRTNLSLAGSLVALAGNLGGLARNQRFLDRDLNRAWTADNVVQLRSRDPATDNAEDREQRELLEVFEDCMQRARGPVVFLDLHTSSAAGASFS